MYMWLMLMLVLVIAAVVLWWLAPGVLGIILVPMAWLAAIAVWWLVPVLAIAVLMPIFQLVAALNPWAAALVMLLLGTLVAWYFATHGAHVQAVVWGALWGMGALTAALGAFHWYALILESVLVIVLLIPGLVAPGWANLLRWYATGEILLSLLLLWGQGEGLPGPTLVFALLLLAVAALVGSGAYRPFEARRFRRRLSTMATVAAVLLLLWQPVIVPAVHWAGQAAQAAGQAVGQAVAVSPVGRWYHATALQWERRELGEAAKTEALRQVQRPLTEAHKARWEKGIRQIPSLPLSTGEWGDLGVPREADP
jgi:hypothetical protein